MTDAVIYMDAIGILFRKFGTDDYNDESEAGKRQEFKDIMFRVRIKKNIFKKRKMTSFLYSNINSRSYGR